MTTNRTDSIGTTHTAHCWRNAITVLNEEVCLQNLPADSEWVDDGDTVAIWDNARVSTVVADWLSDGTTKCVCVED